MQKIKLPPPTQMLSKADARRFLMAHHHLWPPRKLKGKPGIMALFKHLGCIQYDTINVVGRNADLTLQSRINKYQVELLDELLYKDRELVDGWDKMASIYPTTQRPYFARHRAQMLEYYSQRFDGATHLLPMVLSEIEDRGPLSSIDIKHDGKIDGTWGENTRMVSAALTILYESGAVGIHHKVGTRRVFERSERLLPKALLNAADPNPTKQGYQAWHMLRRVGSMGLAHPGAGEFWLGILGVKSELRKQILTNLVESGKITAIGIESLPGETFFMRTADMETLAKVKTGKAPKSEAAILSPLDNLMWNRKLVNWLFDFEYVWEVYKPAEKRNYGYYVLPVIYGDRFVARFDPGFDKKTRQLTISDWWWQEGVEVDDAMIAALATCLRDFMEYLNAGEIRLGKKAKGKKNLAWVRELAIEG
ncbi:MAG: winged helix DNA-binding domain-containing protein [Anaerolineae bacterium]|nr:winged helix DNA-binding domain-containing protein [Anaerolineae bacterium]